MAHTLSLTLGSYSHESGYGGYLTSGYNCERIDQIDKLRYLRERKKEDQLYLLNLYPVELSRCRCTQKTTSPAPNGVSATNAGEATATWQPDSGAAISPPRILQGASPGAPQLFSPDLLLASQLLHGTIGQEEG